MGCNEVVEPVENLLLEIQQKYVKRGFVVHCVMKLIQIAHLLISMSIVSSKTHVMCHY